jgi:hypothetical protein
MKSFIAACAAVVLIAVGAHYVLNGAGYSTAEKLSHDATVDLD